jgi:hypothetical protein
MLAQAVLMNSRHENDPITRLSLIHHKLWRLSWLDEMLCCVSLEEESMEMDEEEDSFHAIWMACIHTEPRKRSYLIPSF